MPQIIEKRELAANIKLIRLQAPDIAAKARPGQFVILRVDDRGERVPLTLVDWSKENGSITLVFQEAGVSTKKLGVLNVGERVGDVFGPLGNPSDLPSHSSVAVVCGGVGTAVGYSIAKALKSMGNEVTSIVGARTKDLIILKDEMRTVSKDLYICTDDGSEGYKGFVSDVLRNLIEVGKHFSVVYAVGPAVMMRATAEVTRANGIRTIASLNSIMIDGMGMCGACRVTVGGKTRFACIDGPEFDAHLVDFDELIKRQRMFIAEEKSALKRWEDERCRSHGGS